MPPIAALRPPLACLHIVGSSSSSLFASILAHLGRSHAPSSRTHLSTSHLRPGSSGRRSYVTNKTETKSRDRQLSPDEALALREAKSAKNREYYAQRKERIHSAGTRDVLRERKRQWQAENREAINEQHRIWRAANREAVQTYRAKDRARWTANREVCLEKQRVYRQVQGDAGREANRKYVAAKRAMSEEQGQKYKGSIYTLARYPSLARAWRTHTPVNHAYKVQGTCATCEQDKGLMLWWSRNDNPDKCDCHRCFLLGASDEDAWPVDFDFHRKRRGRWAKSIEDRSASGV